MSLFGSAPFSDLPFSAAPAPAAGGFSGSLTPCVITKTGQVLTLTRTTNYSGALSPATLTKTGQVLTLTRTGGFSGSLMPCIITKTGQVLTLTIPYSQTLNPATLTKSGRQLTLTQTGVVSSVIVVGGPPAAKKRKRVFVEIDGETFEVSNEREAAKILTAAKELAEQVATKPEPPKIVVKGKGELAQAVKAQVAEVDIEAAYRAAYNKWLDEDDEDVIRLLLQ